MNQVLVISQNRRLAHLLLDRLELEPDFQVVIIVDYTEILTMNMPFEPDIIIAVINPERPTNIAVIKAIKSYSTQSQLILLVSYIDELVKAKAREVGAVVPVLLNQPEILLTTIYQLLAQRKTLSLMPAAPNF